MADDVQHRLRALPSVDRLATAVARAELAARREAVLAGADVPDEQQLVAGARARLQPSLRRVLNATGVVVHTNLGRAPLADAARTAVARVAAGYSNLELDLADGRRGSRADHVAALLCELTGAEAALAVNNCAAAVLLAVAALTRPSGEFCPPSGHSSPLGPSERAEVVVSRGQLIEIGGAFRVPEVIAQAGARLVEVGTTNRTRLDDYRAALGAGTAAILRAHPSNFRTLGFVEEVEIEALCRLGVPVIDDVGSGVLVDDVPLLDGEPRVRRSVRAGAAVVAFSGDKLLGGPQAGLLVGRAEAIAACARHPLARAVRIDKLSLAALEATLALYRDPALARREIPVLAMLDADRTTLQARAARLAQATGGEIVEAVARVGGGALPLLELPGPAVALDGEPAALAAALRGRSAARRAHPRRPAAAGPAHAARRRGRGGRGGRRRRPAVSDAPLTLGTAGHIDHGKTALVRALTGHDTDRLAEERARGISIELGYAPLRLADGRRLSVVDVPGHERFVRTMVAGATGIDLYLLVVAADDGVMPQTREHWTVLRALDVETGVVAITKADAADPARAAAEARELTGEGPAIVACSSVTGDGVEDVRAALAEVAAQVTGRSVAGGAPVLHVDRSFTVRGAGTVVTGTLWSGELAVGDELLLLPAGRPVRVRGLQVHDAPVQRAPAGQRVAVNLARVERDAVTRGDVLAAADAGLAPAWILEARLELTAEPTGHVHVHHGTRESPARLVALGDGVWQVRAREPLLARPGDRIVIRASAPPDTLGGGVVLVAPARRSRTAGGASDADGPVAPAPRPAALDEAALAVERRLLEAGWEPPPNAVLDADAALAALREHGRVVRLGRDLHIHVDALTEARARVVALIQSEGPATLAQVRDALGTSRRYAQALLERLDADRVTVRRPDDTRVLRASQAG